MGTADVHERYRREMERLANLSTDECIEGMMQIIIELLDEIERDSHIPGLS
jgi:hypothetical protein